jgi:hypothetical protein
MTPTAGRQTESLRAALPGLAVAVLTVLFGFAMGGIFGLNEDIVKNRLATSASAVTATVYQGDAAAAEPVVAKSWEYMQRAHLHGGAIGTAAVGLIVVMLLIGTTPRATRVLSLALGLGGLGYAVFWMWAGFIAPGLGSRDAFGRRRAAGHGDGGDPLRSCCRAPRRRYDLSRWGALTSSMGGCRPDPWFTSGSRPSTSSRW